MVVSETPKRRLVCLRWRLSLPHAHVSESVGARLCRTSVEASALPPSRLSSLRPSPGAEVPESRGQRSFDTARPFASLSPSSSFILLISSHHRWTMAAASLLLLFAAPLAHAFIIGGNHMTLSRLDPIVNPYVSPSSQESCHIVLLVSLSHHHQPTRSKADIRNFGAGASSLRTCMRSSAALRSVWTTQQRTRMLLALQSQPQPTARIIG